MFIKVLVMMLGELEYDDLFQNADICGKDNDKHVSFPGTSHILIAIFILMVAMVLMNVLFGLAVADIQVGNNKLCWNNTNRLILNG